MMQPIFVPRGPSYGCGAAITFKMLSMFLPIHKAGFSIMLQKQRFHYIVCSVWL